MALPKPYQAAKKSGCEVEDYRLRIATLVMQIRIRRLVMNWKI
jgi:hypothetical protein